MKDRNFPDSISELEFVRTELEREKKEEDSIFSKDWLSRPIPDRIRQGITLYPIVYEEQTLGREGSWTLTFRFSNQEEYPIKFQTGAPVQLGKNEDRIRAILVSLHKEKLKFRSKKFRNGQKKENVFWIFYQMKFLTKRCFTR